MSARDLNAGNSHERGQVLPPESAFASAHGSIAAPSTKNHQAYPLISKRITIHCCCGSFVTLPRLKDPVTGPQPFLPVRLGFPFGLAPPAPPQSPLYRNRPVGIVAVSAPGEIVAHSGPWLLRTIKTNTTSWWPSAARLPVGGNGKSIAAAGRYRFHFEVTSFGRSAPQKPPERRRSAIS
jgi:hypothetical protein